MVRLSQNIEKVSNYFESWSHHFEMASHHIELVNQKLLRVSQYYYIMSLQHLQQVQQKNSAYTQISHRECFTAELEFLQ